MKYDIATPYVAVYTVFRKDNKIAFLLRENTTWMNGHYGLPGGKVEEQESILLATVREAKEEAGVTIEPKNLKLILTGHRHHKDSDWVDAVFEVTTWQGTIHNAEPHVHGELAWFDPDDLPQNIVPYTRDYVEQIQAGNNYAEWGWEKKN
jgi:8-oxo-dGTP diphosphatase